jgi:hypothetical protein
VDQQRIIAQVKAVVVHLIYIHLSDSVRGTDQKTFHIPGQIPAIEKPE